MKKIVKTYTLQGKAKNKKEAINNALTTIQNTVMQDYPDDLILKIEPQDLIIVAADYQQHIEHFLFLKKNKDVFDCTIELTVEITVVEIN